MSAASWNRKLHRIGAILIALPLLLVIATGILLQVKKQVAWVQPPTAEGSSNELELTFDEILAAAATAGVEIRSWDDIDRLDVRPAKGIVKVRGKNRQEVQIDTRTGDVLQVGYRRSDLIESLHDGSWFHDTVKLAIFLPAGIVLLGLWGTGIYLFLLPYIVRRRRKVRR